MFYFSVKRIFLLFLTVAFAAADESTPEYWLSQLQDEAFERREEATEKLWRFGDSVLPLLDQLEAENSADPELAARALKIQRKVVIGITPDTPLEVVALVEKYFESNRRGREIAVRGLIDLEAYDLILRLHRLERNTEMKKSLANRLQRVMPKLMDRERRAGNEERFRELLHYGDDFTSLVRCGEYLRRQGELEAEIGRLRNDDSPEATRRYLAYLRVKGDLPLLKAEGKRLGDASSFAIASLLLGDMESVYELLLKRNEATKPDQHYLKWALANWRGEPEDEAHFESVTQLLYDRQHKERAMANLYRMGRPALIETSFTEETSWAERYDYLINTDQTLRVLGSLQIDQLPLTKEWLSEAKERLLLEWDRDGARPTNKRLVYAASYLEARGYPNEATRIYQAIFDAIRASESNSLLEWIRTQLANHSLYALEKALSVALAREVDEFKLNLEDLLETLFPNSAYRVWLYEEIREENAELSSEKIISLVFSFHGRFSVPEEEFEKWFQLLNQRAHRDMEEHGDDLGLRMMKTLCLNLGRGNDFLQLSLEEGEPANLDSQQARLDRAQYAVYLGDYGQARVAYEAILAEEPKNGMIQVGSVQVGLAAVLEILGESQKASVLREEAFLTNFVEPGGVIGACRVEASYAVQSGDYRTAFEKNLKAMLCMENYFLSYQSFVSQIIADEALRLRDWKIMRAFQELAVWQYRDNREQYYLNARYKAKFARGMILFEQGALMEAEALLTEAHNLIAGSGLLADDFFPVLREVGLTDLHDRLCQKSLSRAREVIEAFPNDANARNNFGWIASRAARSLEEAEEHMKVALAIEPMSVAYLDTLAEVYFARREREKAVKWSKKSFYKRVNDQQLREQYERFRTGDFPVK